MIDFQPRILMEKAIEVMRQSILEPRTDGKESPKVGAVLVDVGDDVPSRQRMTTAYRGELRLGDHAEFTSTTLLPPEVLKSLSDTERVGWQWLTTKRRAKSSDYAEAIEVDNRTARRHLTRFANLGLVRTIGSGPATEYEVA